MAGRLFYLAVAYQFLYFSRGMSVVLFYSWQVCGNSVFVLIVAGQWFYFSCGRLVVLF